MNEYTQDKRLISISSPLKKDELLLTSFEGVELISDLFEFQIEVLSKNHSIKPEALIGKTVTLTIQNDIGRTFNGFVSQFVYGEVQGENLRTYRLTMVPWLWFLSKTNNHRIFQEKNSIDIITQVFQDLGFNDYEFQASDSYPAREYCVQHNESDLNFISRLLEEDGLAYYFEQKEDSHVMKIVDAANAYELCKETDLTYSKGNQPNTQINRWEHVFEFRKGKWTLNDYDFKQPKKSQLQTTASTSIFANAKNYEHYEYTPYHDFSGLKDLTKKRIEAEEAPIDTIEASSDCSSFYAGGKFKLSKHAAKDEQGSYIITALRHRAYDSSYLAGEGSGSDYSNDFACIPDNVHYRPPLVHPKPVMPGPQSALVVGPSGEEIYVDEYGRIKVQFHWDRVGKKDEKSTCYIQVMQPWAGSGWGTSFIPRIGMEVVVNFYDGDPDRPIIMGSVYNGDNSPPFSSKTQSGIRTRSTKGGSAGNFNEIQFEDKDGEKYIHVQQSCGNELYMHEEKGIEIRDKFGNEIVMDAVAGTMKLRSPSHESVIDLGKSIYWGTLSDMTREVGMNANFICHGSKDEWVAGPVKFKYDGINVKIHGGAVSDIFGGLKESTVLGGSWSLNYAYEYSNNFAKRIRKSTKPLTYDSEMQVHLIAGAGDDTQLNLKLGNAVLKSGMEDSINIKKGQSIDIESGTKIILDAKEIEISGKTIKIGSKEAEFKSRKIKHKHITIG